MNDQYIAVLEKRGMLPYLSPITDSGCGPVMLLVHYFNSLKLATNNALFLSAMDSSQHCQVLAISVNIRSPLGCRKVAMLLGFRPHHTWMH